MPQLTRAFPLPCALALAAALMLGAAPALAQTSMDQVTDEQQEACAPDAVRLCQNTIPDIGRTTACMRRHEAELSPRCRTVFNEATGGGATEPRERVARPDEDFDDAPRLERRRAARIAPEADDDYGPPSYEYLTPDGDPAATGPRRGGRDLEDER